MKFNLNGSIKQIITVETLSSKTIFYEHWMATMDEVFDGAVVKKTNTFLLNSNVQNLFVLVSKQRVKQLIYQRKMGVTRHLYIAHQNNHHLPQSEHYISHIIFDMLVFLVILCASTKVNCILVCQPYCVVQNYPGVIKASSVTRVEKMRMNNSRERP